MTTSLICIGLVRSLKETVGDVRKYDEKQSFKAHLLFCCLLGLSSLAVGQNTCAYPINLKNFSFCLTTSGTIVSLPGILASSNAVEGWEISVYDIQGGHGGSVVYPGLGYSSPSATASQPHG